MGHKGQDIFDKYSEIITMLVESNMSQEFIEKVKKILVSIADDFDNNKKLTIKEKEAIDFVNIFIVTYGKNPSYDEVSKELGISKTAAYARLRNYRYKMKNK
jgi:hypothetical protein